MTAILNLPSGEPAVLDPRKYPAASQLALGIAAFSLMTGGSLSRTTLAAESSGTATPIEHLVVIFQENVSFDHYFATYPVALNPSGEPSFEARADTPSVNGLGNLV